MLNSVSPSLASIIFYEALFLFSGFFQSLAQQFLYYQGAATGLSLLTNTAMYMGMAAVGFLLLPNMPNRKSIDDSEGEINMATESRKDYQLLPEEAEEDIITDTEDPISIPNGDDVESPEEVVDYKMIIFASFLDVIANFVLTIGFFYIGSGMYQVIFSSVVIWCAIFSFFFLGRKLSFVQSVSIVGVSFGLALSAFGINQSTLTNTTPPPSSSTGGSAVPHSYQMSSTMFGMILTSLSTIGYACVYVVSDQILTAKTTYTRPPSPKKVCFLVGTTSTIISFIYIIFYTIPNWNTLITQEMEKKEPHSSTFVIVTIYLLLVFASFVHNLAYYWLMKEIGNVSIGILNSLRAIVIFGFSHLMFCRTDKGQCLDVWKGWSGVVVIGFVTIFSISKSRESN